MVPKVIFAERAAGRALAREITEAFASELREVNAYSFVDELREKLLSPAEPPPAKIVEPLARLEQTVIPFGKCADQRFADVPFEYLDWLCRSQEEFLVQLQTYLRHPDLNRSEGDDDS